ncbi:hypothetical protein K1T71_003965 [Dendrolimus kikuchii]|uniref:Uncharacterized protein n=1 Tax=Dendrolimus kikuchii TaxID=765133 RepID=A0ACC1D9Q8_9NEOP|nr:hypothetical protein K1T71_003965 [Dendrolimus kikuchii]
MTDKVSIYYQNCRGLRTKLNTLYSNILTECYDILILSETWLTANISDCEVVDPRYVLHRCDRDRMATGKQDGGGVLIATRRDLSADRCFLTLGDNEQHNMGMLSLIDYVFLKLKVGNKYYVVCGVYIPPNTNTKIYSLFLNALLNELNDIIIENFYMVGDFNLPHLEWKEFTLNLSCTSYCNLNIATLIYNFLQSTKSKQYNDIKNSMGRVLDLFISNCESVCEPMLSPLVAVDCLHPPFSTFICLGAPYQIMSSFPIFKYCFLEGKYAIINDEIQSIDWSSRLNNSSMDLSVNSFYEVIYDIIRKYIPKRRTKTNNFPIWFSRPLIHIFKNKEKAWIKWKKYNTTYHYEQFSMFRRRFKTQSKICFNNYIDTVEDNLKRDVKTFWSYVKSHKRKCGIPHIMNYEDVKSKKPEEVCQLFANFFASVYERSQYDGNPENLETMPINTNCDLALSELLITKKQIVTELKALDITKGPGPDGLPPFFLKNTAETVAVPLLILYNRSLMEGIVPSNWKMANITPVYKGGNITDVTNYRPISLLSTLSKVLERLVHNYIYPVLHKQIMEQQHGFVKKRSTVSNLLIFTDFVFKSMDNRIQVDTVYTDFRKAFDKVDHDILLRKLAFNGIRGNLLRWFTSYIKNRSQRVVIYGLHSDIIYVTSGVAQGSILGPLLFDIFINDINQCFKQTNFLMYADDLKIFKEIFTIQDCIKLQDDLNSLSDYCVENKLYLSINKCKSISFSKKTNKIDFTYSLCSNPLEKVTVIKDLGIFLDSKLHFDFHVNYVLNKAFQLFGFVMRTCKPFKRPSSYLLLYMSLIRSQLEYATAIWNPFYTKYNKQLESVQRKFLRSVNYRCFHSKSSYETLLSKYSMHKLETRRNLLDAMLLYNICHDKFDCITLSNQISFRVPQRFHVIRKNRTRDLFAAKISRTNAGERAPINRIMKLYNEYYTEADIFFLTPSLYKKKIIELSMDVPVTHH